MMTISIIPKQTNAIPPKGLQKSATLPHRRTPKPLQRTPPRFQHNLDYDK